MNDKETPESSDAPQLGESGSAASAFGSGVVEEAEPDPSLLREQQARGAAGDLARMGIDPRSLGLEIGPELDAQTEPQSPSPAQASPSPSERNEPDFGGSVVPLRPIFPAQPGGMGAGVPAFEQRDETPAPSPAIEQHFAAPPATPPVKEAGRFIRAVGRGLVTPDAAVAAQSERDLVDMVRLRQSDRRVVTFLSGKGGVGCTTVAVGVGTTFMALREDRTVLIDVQSGTPSLGHSQRVGETLSVSGLLQELEVTDPPLSPAGLGLIDGAGWDDTVTRSGISGVLDRLGEQHVFHLIDAGNDPGEGGHAALARADQVVLVTGPGQLGAYALGVAMDRIQTTNPTAAAGVVHVVVCQSEEAYRATQREAGNAPGVVVVGPDPALLDGGAFDPSRVSGATREAVLRVAAAVALGGRRR